MIPSRVRRVLRLRPFLLLAFTAALIAATARSTEAQSQKSPWVAGGLSMVLPGTGQFYNGQWGKGGLMLGGAAGSALMVFSGVVCADHSNDCPQLNVGAAAFIGIWAWSIIDGARTSNSINRRMGSSALEIGPQLATPGGDSLLGLSLVRVKF